MKIKKGYLEGAGDGRRPLCAVFKLIFALIKTQNIFNRIFVPLFSDIEFMIAYTLMNKIQPFIIEHLFKFMQLLAYIFIE